MPLILLHDDDLQLLTTRELRRYISSVCDQVRQLAFDLAWHQATSAERLITYDRVAQHCQAVKAAARLIDRQTRPL